MVLEPTTPELSKSRSALISSQTLPDIQERFAATIWVSTPSQRYRLPYVACIAQRSSDQPRRWFQYYAPADHSTNLYVRFYGVVRPPSACPTLSTSPGRRAGRSLMDSMPFTGRGLHSAGRFSSEAPTICLRHLACRGGYRSWPAFGPSRAGPCSRSSILDPGRVECPGVLGALRLCKAQDSPQASTPYLQRLVAHPTTARTETLPGATPTTPPSPSATPWALAAPAPPPPPSVKLFIPAPAPSGQACAVIMTRNL